MTNTNEYQRGYRAGKRKSAADALVEKRERIYMQCLELVVRECAGWSIGDKKINDAQGYCYLAKIFTDSSISKLG